MRREHKSWIQLTQERATRFADKSAYIFLEDGERISETITYQEVDTRARTLAAQLQGRCRPGERVLLIYESCVENMIAFFGCLYAGLIAVPVCMPHRNRRNARLENIVGDCSPRLALSTAKQLEEIARRLDTGSRLQELEWLASDTANPAEATQWREPVANDDTLAFLQYTSGSLGTPKGVAVSHGNLLHNQAMMAHAFQTGSHSTIVSWLPIFHDMGLIGQMLHAFYAGGSCVFMAPMSFLQEPLRWLKAISTYKADISAGPNFSYNLCEQKIPACSSADVDLSSWRVAINGAEPVQHQTIERFSQRFAPWGFQKKAFYPGYGMAEATLIISGGSVTQMPVCRWIDGEAMGKDKIVASSPALPSAKAVVGCGAAILDEQILVVDTQTLRPCADDQIGEIWVSGRHVARGYWGKAEATRDTFQAYLSDGRGPFLRTGDLGFQNGSDLFITGRLKDVIILHGTKYYPHDIEASIQAEIPAIRADSVATVGVTGPTGEQVIVVAEVRRDMLRKTDLQDVANSIRRVVSKDHGLALQDVLLIRPGTLPKTTSGKIQRRVCGDLYLSQGFQICHQAATYTASMSAAAS